MRRRSRPIVLLPGVFVLALTACLHHETPPSTPADLRSSAAEHGYIDLQSGWNVRVVFPKLRSGGYVLPSMRQGSVTGNTVEMQADDDFIGYEKDFYKVQSHGEDRVEVRFVRAGIWEKGRGHRRAEPGLLLFPNTSDGRYIRLVYLIRESAVDHDMAIISATRSETLDALTQGVILRAECKSDETATCKWVPKGVAVDPEK